MRRAAALLPSAILLSVACVTPPAEAQSYRVEEVVGGLTFPWAMQFLPDGAVLVTEKNPGRLRIVKDGLLDPTPVSGVPEVAVRGQGGLLDVRLHPDFAQNSMVYLSYSKACDDGNGATTAVARGTLDRAAHALRGVEDIFVFNACTRRGQHFGSRMVFDDDGYLFVTVGDRGEMDQAQNTANHQGTLNRLNDDGTIPSDNPFVGRPGYEPSIWAFGIRSPQGLAIHPETRELWETEHGPQGGDELNLMEPGNNYGWPIITYGVNYGRERRPIGDGITEAPGLEQPVHYWDPSIATSSLMIYDGDAFPEWKGDAFVGGLAGLQIARVTVNSDGSTSEAAMLADRQQRIRDVRQGPDGYIYVLTDVGNEQAQMLRIVPVS